MSQVPMLLGEVYLLSALEPGHVSLRVPVEGEAILMNHFPPFDQRAVDVHIAAGSVAVTREDRQPFLLKTFGTNDQGDYVPMFVYDTPQASLTFQQENAGRRWGALEVPVTSDNQSGLLQFAELIGKYAFIQQGRDKVPKVIL